MILKVTFPVCWYSQPWPLWSCSCKTWWYYIFQRLLLLFKKKKRILHYFTTFLKPVRKHPVYCVSMLVFHWITGKHVCIYPPFARRSWRTLRRHRACLQRQQSPSCLVSWPWWTYWCLPALSTSARLKQRRTCRQEGWWGNASAWVCASSMYLSIILSFNRLVYKM